MKFTDADREERHEEKRSLSPLTTLDPKPHRLVAAFAFTMRPLAARFLQTFRSQLSLPHPLTGLPSASPQAWQAVREQLGACRHQLRRTDDAERRLGHQDGHPQAEEELEAECAWLAQQIQRAHLRMILLIEQLGTTQYLKEYRLGFKAYAKKLDQTYRPEYDPEFHESEALDYIIASLATLSASMEERKHGRDIDGVAQIKAILGAADFIVARAGVSPKCEKDVQDALFEYLRILHPGTRREVPIPHVIKTFKADIGIDALGLLIEVKFIDSPLEARSECPGFFEDMFGYRGDRKWKHHFALVYSTGPHVRQEELQAEFDLAECPIDWMPIAVWGAGGRVERERAVSRPARRAKRTD